MYIFKYEDTEDECRITSRTDVELKIDTESLDDLLEAFERFLLGCGFGPKGRVDIVEEEGR